MWQNVPFDARALESGKEPPKYCPLGTAYLSSQSCDIDKHSSPQARALVEQLRIYYPRAAHSSSVSTVMEFQNALLPQTLYLFSSFVFISMTTLLSHFPPISIQALLLASSEKDQQGSCSLEFIIQWGRQIN